MAETNFDKVMNSDDRPLYLTFHVFADDAERVLNELGAKGYRLVALHIDWSRVYEVSGVMEYQGECKRNDVSGFGERAKTNALLENLKGL